jgi:hypothetical protein
MAHMAEMALSPSSPTANRTAREPLDVRARSFPVTYVYPILSATIHPMRSVLPRIATASRGDLAQYHLTSAYRLLR